MVISYRSIDHRTGGLFLLFVVIVLQSCKSTEDPKPLSALLQEQLTALPPDTLDALPAWDTRDSRLHALKRLHQSGHIYHGVPGGHEPPILWKFLQTGAVRVDDLRLLAWFTLRYPDGSVKRNLIFWSHGIDSTGDEAWCVSHVEVTPHMQSSDSNSIDSLQFGATICFQDKPRISDVNSFIRRWHPPFMYSPAMEIDTTHQRWIVQPSDSQLVKQGGPSWLDSNPMLEWKVVDKSVRMNTWEHAFGEQPVVYR